MAGMLKTPSQCFTGFIIDHSIREVHAISALFIASSIIKNFEALDNIRSSKIKM